MPQRRINRRPKEFLSGEDRALLAREFESVDPLAEDNLTFELPDDLSSPVIERYYDAAPAGRKKAGHAPHIPCVLRHGAAHWKGYVILLKNGQRILVGQICAAKHFGADFRAVENDFGSQRKRKYAVRRLLAIREQLPSTLHEIEALSLNSVISDYDDYLEEFRLNFHCLHHVLGFFQRLSGSMSFTKRARDQSAEERLVERSLPKSLKDRLSAAENGDAAQRTRVQRELKAYVRNWRRTMTPIWIEEEVEAGRLHGGAALGHPSPASASVLSILKELRRKAVLLRTETSGNFTVGRIETLERDLREIGAEINRLHLRLQALAQFAEPANLYAIVDWSKRDRLSHAPRLDREIETDGKAIIDSEWGTRLELPVTYSVSELPESRRLERILSGKS